MFLETAANPYVTELGDKETAASRLNLAQSFNGLGCVCGPLFGGLLLFSDAEGAENRIALPYVVMAAVALSVAIAFTRIKLPEIPHKVEKVDETKGSKLAHLLHNKAFLLALLPY